MSLNGTVKYWLWLGCGGAVIPALGRLRKEDVEFKVSLGYLGRPCLKE
jgi:hypothetical protein